MTKRVIWIAFFIIPAAIIALAAWHARHHRTYANANGAATDLTPREFDHAVEILLRERKMWSHFHSLDGHITFDRVEDNTNRHSLSGDISIKQLRSRAQGMGGLVWPFVMVISNNQEGWVFTSDGTIENTEIDCENQKQIEDIKGMIPQVILPLLMLPKKELVPLFMDDIFPHGGDRINDVIGWWSPWRNQNAQGIADSYTFRDKDGRADVISFTNGHVSSWHRGNINREHGGDAVQTFSDPVESNQIWFPTRTEFKTEGECISVKLSDIIINNVH